jgi:hypothetical protein
MYVHQAKPANPARKSLSLSVMGIISESSGDKTVMQRGCWLIRVGPPRGHPSDPDPADRWGDVGLSRPT